MNLRAGESLALILRSQETPPRRVTPLRWNRSNHLESLFILTEPVNFGCCGAQDQGGTWRTLQGLCNTLSKRTPFALIH